MATFEERIYSLGVDALAEQERHVAEIRGRASVLVAAGAVVPSLLARGVFSGPHPHGVVEISAASVGLLGAAAVLLFAVLLLRPYEIGFAVRVEATYRALWKNELSEQPALDLALAEAFEQRRRQNGATVKRLAGCLASRLHRW